MQKKLARNFRRSNFGPLPWPCRDGRRQEHGPGQGLGHDGAFGQCLAEKFMKTSPTLRSPSPAAVRATAFRLCSTAPATLPPLPAP